MGTLLFILVYPYATMLKSNTKILSNLANCIALYIASGNPIILSMKNVDSLTKKATSLGYIQCAASSVNSIYVRELEDLFYYCDLFDMI